MNLLANFPQRIKIVEEEYETGPEESKWIKIKYDYVPKYFKTCKKQGHNEQQCWVINPQLHKKQEDVVEEQGKEKNIIVQSSVT